MAYLDLITPIHRSTKRDYRERGFRPDKAACVTVAKRFGQEYWDGDRKYGYGGYHYDGRWYPFAERLARHYRLGAGSAILDVGCGKGYLLYELTRVIPNAMVAGIDISEYAIQHAKEEVKPFLRVGNAIELPYGAQGFDLVVSINTLHNLYNYQLRKALQEIERVARHHKYIVVDAYRTEQEKVNLLNWQLTCTVFYTPDEWKWFLEESGYTGDYDYVFYE